MHKIVAGVFIYSYIAKCESRLIDSSNTGSFFDYANNKFGSKTAVGPVDPVVKAESLQKSILIVLRTW